MDFTLLLSGLRKALDAAKTITPIAEALGGDTVAKAMAYVSAAREIAENIATRIAEGAIVASTNDQERIQAVIRELAAENDRLSAIIDAS